MNPAKLDALCARHGAYYRQMAEDAHEGLRGATGPLWRDRLTSELGNLRAALDWFIARADADAALSLASGMAWLWFINSDVVEGARWLADALSATGPRRPELAATAQVWHSYFVCMAFSPAAAVPECDAAVAALRTSGDQTRRAEALLFSATVLMRAQESERSLGALSEAHDLLEPAVHGWLLAVHDWIVAENLTLLGQFDDAEQAARSSAERFDTQGEAWFSVGSLSILAGIAAARGDLDGASAAYGALLERCRAAGQSNFVLFSLVRLAALRARQGDDAAADGLYEEAIACSFNPSVSADVMVGQAAVARRLGDLARARALLDAAGTYYGNVGLPAGQTGVLAGLAWWALSAGQADDAMVFAADACQAAAASGDPAVQLLADTAVAAVRALADPTRPNIEAFVALAQKHAQSLSYGSLTSFTDEPDVAALAARLALPSRLAATRGCPQSPLSVTSGQPGKLGLMQPAQGQPFGQQDHLDASGPALEDHGRAVTASLQAATWYRQAQRALDRGLATTALRHAVEADPAFELALADLDAMTGTSGHHHSRGQMNWERHHIEVVRTAASGNGRRAADLLREHLAAVGCDPLAFRIVAQARQPAGMDDDFENLAGRLPDCHPTRWPSSP